MLNISKEYKYLLACSSGPDSMALFDMLIKEGYKFDVAHVNYHFRKESNNEQHLLEEYCQRLNIKLYVLDVDEKVESNIEEKAREIRYEYFAKLNKLYGYDYLLVAHNKDDHLETYLLQKQRKNLPNFYGIQNISMVNGIKICRPLLNYYKDDLLKYCIDNNVPYSLDSSNYEKSFKRNIIRHDVLSKYSLEDKDRLCKLIEEENVTLNSLLNRLNSSDLKSIKFLIKLDDIELAYSLTILIRKFIPQYECSMRFVKEIRKVLLSDKSNVEVKLNDQYYLSKEYNLLFVRPNDFSFDDIVVDTPRLIDNDLFYFDLEKCGDKKNIKPTDYPLIIRPYRKGDKYKINDYEVPVNRLFIDWKMPKFYRKIWPVFISGGKVIYIPRYQQDFSLENDPFFYIKSCFALKK